MPTHSIVALEIEIILLPTSDGILKRSTTIFLVVSTIETVPRLSPVATFEVIKYYSALSTRPPGPTELAMRWSTVT